LVIIIVTDCNDSVKLSGLHNNTVSILSHRLSMIWRY